MIKIKSIIQGIALILLHIIFQGEVSALAHSDSSAIRTIRGKVVDIATNEPLVFTNIYLKGTGIGTVSNSDGEFIIKIPYSAENEVLVLSSIGYNNTELPISRFNAEINLVKLEPVSIPIAEVTIVFRDARELLINALDKISDNYSTHPVMLTSFYRESIKKRKKYLFVSEAVLDGYKASYTSLVDMDRVRIFKGRKSSDINKLDTIVLKLQGGPHTMFQLDFVKNPGELLEREMMQYYRYKLNGVVNIDDRQAYVLSFEQSPEIEVPLYEGKFYIGVDDFAIIGAEFRISVSLIDKASEYIVQKKPPGIQVDIEKANYIVNFHFNEDKWYFNYVRTELVMGIKWKKRLFSSRYTVRSEMAVTDIDTENITRHKFNETTRSSDILTDQVSDFEDSDFWGDYNIIQPEESIQSAIEKMGRKLKRKKN